MTSFRLTRTGPTDATALSFISRRACTEPYIGRLHFVFARGIVLVLALGVVLPLACMEPPPPPPEVTLESDPDVLQAPVPLDQQFEAELVRLAMMDDATRFSVYESDDIKMFDFTDQLITSDLPDTLRLDFFLRLIDLFEGYDELHSILSQDIMKSFPSSLDRTFGEVLESIHQDDLRNRIRAAMTRAGLTEEDGGPVDDA